MKLYRFNTFLFVVSIENYFRQHFFTLDFIFVCVVNCLIHAHYTLCTHIKTSDLHFVSKYIYIVYTIGTFRNTASCIATNTFSDFWVTFVLLWKYRDFKSNPCFGLLLTSALCFIPGRIPLLECSKEQKLYDSCLNATN